MLAALQYHLLRLIAPQVPSTMGGEAYEGKSKLRILLPGIELEIKDKVLLDFGCGPGVEVKEMALLGARRVIGLDIGEKWLQLGREQAEKAGVAAKCDFVTSVASPVEVIVSLDSFEHFANPAPSCRPCIRCSNRAAAPSSASAPSGITRWAAICSRFFLGPTLC